MTTTEGGSGLGDAVTLLPTDRLAIGLAVGGLLGVLAPGVRRWRR